MLNTIKSWFKKKNSIPPPRVPIPQQVRSWNTLWDICSQPGYRNKVLKACSVESQWDILLDVIHHHPTEYEWMGKIIHEIYMTSITSIVPQSYTNYVERMEPILARLEKTPAIFSQYTQENRWEGCERDTKGIKEVQSIFQNNKALWLTISERRDYKHSDNRSFGVMWHDYRKYDNKGILPELIYLSPNCKDVHAFLAYWVPDTHPRFHWFKSLYHREAQCLSALLGPAMSVKEMAKWCHNDGQKNHVPIDVFTLKTIMATLNDDTLPWQVDPSILKKQFIQNFYRMMITIAYNNRGYIWTETQSDSVSLLFRKLIRSNNDVVFEYPDLYTQLGRILPTETLDQNEFFEQYKALRACSDALLVPYRFTDESIEAVHVILRKYLTEMEYDNPCADERLKAMFNDWENPLKKTLLDALTLSLSLKECIYHLIQYPDGNIPLSETELYLP